MPLVQITTWEGKDKETKKEIIRTVTKDIADIIGAEPDAVNVIIYETPRENCGEGGVPGDEMDVHEDWMD